MVPHREVNPASHTQQHTTTALWLALCCNVALLLPGLLKKAAVIWSRKPADCACLSSFEPAERSAICNLAIQKLMGVGLPNKRRCCACTAW